MTYFSHTINYLTTFAAILFIASLFAGASLFDVHMQDTYFVINLRKYFTLLAFVLLAIWTIYKLADTLVYSSFLTRINVISSIAVIAILCVLPFVLQILYTPGSRTTVIPSDPAKADRYMSDLSRNGMLFSAMVLLFLAGQTFLLLNIIFGVLHRFRK